MAATVMAAAAATDTDPDEIRPENEEDDPEEA
jgi:hypothetical protein